jgi:hypothetical protein
MLLELTNRQAALVTASALHYSAESRRDRR